MNAKGREKALEVRRASSCNVSPAAEAAAKSPPDGYTLFFGTMGTLAINLALYPKLRYDPIKDFEPVAQTHITPRILVVGPSLAKVDSVVALIAAARARPRGLTYGSAGNGSSSNLSGALFETLAGVTMVHVPYKGSSPLLVDVLSGRVDMTFDSYTVYEDHIRSGRVRALAVTSKSRLGVLPNVPTLAESGLAGYDVSNWLGVLGERVLGSKVTLQRIAGAGHAMVPEQPAAVAEAIVAWMHMLAP